MKGNWEMALWGWGYNQIKPTPGWDGLIVTYLLSTAQIMSLTEGIKAFKKRAIELSTIYGQVE